VRRLRTCWSNVCHAGENQPTVAIGRNSTRRPHLWFDARCDNSRRFRVEESGDSPKMATPLKAAVMLSKEYHVPRGAVRMTFLPDLA